MAPFTVTLMVVVVPSSGTTTTFCELKPLLECISQFLSLVMSMSLYVQIKCTCLAGLAQSVGALDCRVGGRGFDSRGRTNTQGLEMTEK